MNKKFCSKCGKKLKKGELFCSDCQHNERENKKKKSKTKFKSNKKIIIILAASILSVGLITGIVIKFNVDAQTAKQEMKQAIKKYKKDVYGYNYMVLSSLANIEKVGNTILSYWHDYIYDSKYTSIDDAVSKALEDKSELVETIKEHDKNIKVAYKLALKLPNNKNSELKEIKEAVKDLYDDYYDFYDLVMSPSGNYTSFNSNFSDLDSSSVKKYRNLNILLGYDY